MNPQGVTESEPSTEWVNEDNCDTLLLYLPGFMKEQLRVQLRSRTLIISGQHDNKLSQFRKEFDVAEQCDLKKISAKFEDSILYVKLPKSTTPEAKQEAKPPTNEPASVPKTQVNEPKVGQEVNPTSLTQPNENSEEKVGGVKDPNGVCENASKKNMMPKMKPWRNDVIKVLVLVVGFVVGVYWTKMIQSRIG